MEGEFSFYFSTILKGDSYFLTFGEVAFCCKRGLYWFQISVQSVLKRLLSR